MRLYRKAQREQTLRLVYYPNHILVAHGLLDRLQRAVITAAADSKVSEVLLQWGSQVEVLGLDMDHTLFVISSQFKLAT